MPDINGKKIPQLDPLPADQDPLFVVGGEDGKGYNVDKERILKIFNSAVKDGDTVPVANDLNNVIEPGIYILNQNSYGSGVYQNSHYIPGVMLTSDLILSVEVFSTGDIIQRILWPFEGGESVRRKVLNNASWAHGKPWTIWEHWGGVYWIDGNQSSPFKEAGGMNALTTQGVYIVNMSFTSASAVRSLNLPAPDNSTYNGAIYVEVFGRNNYESTTKQWIIQRVHFIRDGSLSGGGGSDRSMIFERRYNMFVPTDADNNSFWGDWILQTNTLAGTSQNGFTAADKTLSAGTATLPSFVLAKGVNKQTTSVKGAINYNGTGLFITLDDGKTYPITLGTALP